MNTDRPTAPRSDTQSTTPAAVATAEQTWSIVILCYNEAATVVDVVERTRTVLAEISSDSGQIVLVDDGSSDGSTEMIRDLAGSFDEIDAVIHRANCGIGPSLRDGYRAARGDNVVAIPADGQFDVRELLPHANIPAQTIVAFYRRENETYSLFRNVLSLVNRLLNRWLLGCHLRDVNWATVYKTEALADLDLRLTSSLVESEICAKLFAGGVTAIEVPSVYHQRTAGQSKGGSLRTVLQAAREMLKLVWIVFRFRQAATRRIH